jgi:hypothetical protein
MQRLLMGWVSASLVLLLFAGEALASSEDEAAAVDAATAWLALIDAGKFGESWEEAGSLFQGAVPKPRWEETLAGTRRPLGKVISRAVKSKQYRTSLPGAPDGRYVVIQFETSFENKAEAVETVTPMHEGGSWRVTGYYIK